MNKYLAHVDSQTELIVGKGRSKRLETTNLVAQKRTQMVGQYRREGKRREQNDCGNEMKIQNSDLFTVEDEDMFSAEEERAHEEANEGERDECERIEHLYIVYWHETKGAE